MIKCTNLIIILTSLVTVSGSLSARTLIFVHRNHSEISALHHKPSSESLIVHMLIHLDGEGAALDRITMESVNDIVGSSSPRLA
jgi:hypothetical protein